MRCLVTLSLALTVAAFGFAEPASAAYTWHVATITSLGCHAPSPTQTDPVWDTCFVTISPPATAVGPCNPDDIRWDAGSPAGRNILATLQGAFLAGKAVKFGVKTDGCYSLQGGHGTFEHVYVLQ